MAAKVENIKNTEEKQMPDGLLRTLASTLVSRAALQASLGKSFGGNRDIYEALGYKKNPQFEDYWNCYDRQDIARRVVDAFPNACWRKKPEVTQEKESETAFEKEWKKLIHQHKVYHYLKRADIISGIGLFGLIFIGFDDVTDRLELVNEVKNAKAITYLRPVMENNIQIKTWDKEPTSERYGMPLTYDIKTQASGMDVSETLTVHYTRVIHLAENPQEGDLYGTPRLKSVLNRLQDLELVSGGSGEMFWRGAFPGYNFSVDKDFDFSTKSQADLTTEIDEYVHDLKRYIRTQGVTAESLSQQVSDPTGHADLFLKLISGSTGIPVRILTGSERGELASSQDESNWNDRVDERRLDYLEPFILRPFIDRLILVGILPDPGEDDYQIIWPDIDIPSEKEEADISKVRADTLAVYVNSQGADMIVTPEIFLKKFMNFTDEDIEQMAEALGGGESLDDAYAAAKEEADRKQQEQFESQANVGAAAAVVAKGLAPPAGTTKKAKPEKSKVKSNQRQALINHAKHDQKTHGRWAHEGMSFVGEGKAGRWARSDGTPLSPSDQKRLGKLNKKLTNVKIAADPKAALIAIGQDSKGRWQSLYSKQHSTDKAAEKFARIKEFHTSGAADKIQGIAKKKMMDSALDERSRDSAAVIYLVSKTGIRPGSSADTKAKAKAYGATTLEGRHVKIAGDKISFSFIGKKGVQYDHVLKDKELASYMSSKKAGASKPFFSILPSKVTSDFKRFGGKEFKLYDYRTLQGTTTALKTMSKMAAPKTKKAYISAKKQVATAVAKYLNNTPSVALNDYIAPEVFAQWEAKFI